MINYHCFLILFLFTFAIKDLGAQKTIEPFKAEGDSLLYNDIDKYDNPIIFHFPEDLSIYKKLKVDSNGFIADNQEFMESSNKKQGKPRLYFQSYQIPEKPTQIKGFTLINPREAFQMKDDFLLPNSLRFYQNNEYLDTVKKEGHNPDKFQSSTLANIPLSKIFKPFYIKNHEVTNREYHEFVLWVRDSIARTILGEEVDEGKYLIKDSIGNFRINWEPEINWKEDPDSREALDVMFLPEYERFYGHKNLDSRKLVYVYYENGEFKTINIYPDTLCWINDQPYSIVEPMTNMYYWHSAYADYPVVGVSKRQAEAYCIWKTEQLKEVYGNNILVRLPKEHELESTILFSYKEEVSENQFSRLGDNSWICNLALHSYDNRPQLEGNRTSEYRFFNRENVLRKDIFTPVFSTNNGFTFTHPADLSNFKLKDFQKRIGQSNYREALNEVMYNELMRNVTPNGISGLANNVSEWLQEDYETNWKAVFSMRQKQLKYAPGIDTHILSELEQYYDYTCDKNGSLIKGSNWFDSQNSTQYGLNRPGLHAKTFKDPNKAYSTVGFRYVIEILE